MNKAEIMAELPKLKAEERTQVFERLCELQEEDLLRGVGPTAEEMKLLDEALADFERDGNPGTACEVQTNPASPGTGCLGSNTPAQIIT